MVKSEKAKITFLDSDLAQFFSEIDSTKLTCVNAAIFLQTIDYLIRKEKKKSITITIPWLHEEYFKYWSLEATKRNLQRLRRLGILRTRVEYKGLEHATKIWINNRKITELAGQVQEAKREKEAWKRIHNSP